MVTTTQGRSLYVVHQVGNVALRPPSATPGPSAPSGVGALSGEATSTGGTPITSRAATSLDALYGPSADNRLTLVTSASLAPWNRSLATVAVATLASEPFTPTPQQARSPAEDGVSGAAGSVATVALAAQAFVLVVIGSVILYRRRPLRTAYLITTAPLIATIVLLAEALSRLFPAWS